MNAMKKTINVTGNDVTLSGGQGYNVTQNGERYNWLDARFDDSAVNQWTSGENTAYINGDYITIDQDGPKGAQNYVHAKGDNLSLTARGENAAFINGDWARVHFEGTTDLTLSGDFAEISNNGTLVAEIVGYSPNIESYGGPITMTLEADYADAFISSINGKVDTTTVNLADEGYSNWINWKGDADDGHFDRMNFLIGQDTGDTRLWASGGDVVVLAMDGSQSKLNFTGAHSARVVTFGDDVDLDIIAGDTPTWVGTLDSLLPPIGSFGGGGMGMMSSQLGLTEIGQGWMSDAGINIS